MVFRKNNVVYPTMHKFKVSVLTESMLSFERQECHTGNLLDLESLLNATVNPLNSFLSTQYNVPM